MKINLILVSLLCAGFSITGAAYEGYKVYSVSPTSIEQLDALKALENDLNLDFWEQLTRVEFDRSYRILVAPDNLDKFENAMNLNGITQSIVISDVNEMVSGEKQRNNEAKKRGRNVDGIDFTYFWQFEDLKTYLNQIAEKYPNIVKLETLGKTLEENDIIAVKISKSGVVDNSRPLIIVEGTIHAREWISTMVCIHLISELVENSEAHNDLLDGLDWIIVPVMNVDGYRYTHEAENGRFWRKNRSPVTTVGYENCTGVDLNRNFRYKWEVKEGTSNTPCGETWPGDVPESEKETKIISDLMLKYNRALLFLDVHSHGNYLLYPWAYDYILTDTYLEYNELGARVRQAIYNVNKNLYKMGNSAFTLYGCSGVTPDFALGAAKIPLAWTIELPGGGTRGFDIEPARIQSVLDETFPGIREMGLYVQERYIKNK